MKNKNTRQFNFIAVAAYLLLPCLWSGLVLAQWFPYHLAGKQFLCWYILHMITGYLLLYMASKYKPVAGYSLSFSLAGISLVIALTRMVQGVYHHKPIGYLVILTLIHMLVLLIVAGSMHKNSRSSM